MFIFISIMDVGGLFKWLNSPYCEENYYAKLSHENKIEIMDEMLSDTPFLDTAKLLVSDETIIRAKLETKLEQLLKKKQSSLEDDEGKKGKHIGQGIYLLREGHVIKMTTPNFTVYY